jgi:hypothetical protein
MSLEQLIGRHFRLQRELGIAYSTVPWHTGRIDRLANELAATEREIAALQASHRQTDGTSIVANPLSPKGKQDRSSAQL